MNKKSLSGTMIFALAITVLTACSGGGGGAGSTDGGSQATTAERTLSTAVTTTFPGTTTINGYNVTITLPAGVTVDTILNSSATDTGVLTSYGQASGAYIDGVYTAAAGAVPANVKIYIVREPGFSAGDFCKLKVNIAAGFSAPAADFTATLDDATGYDTLGLGSTVTGLQSKLSVTIQ